MKTGKEKVCYEITGPDNVSRDPKHWIIFCPGCNTSHVFDGRWKFNGDQVNPTFTPSMLVNQSLEEPKVVNEKHTSHRCHSYVTNGEIRFLGDCTHELKGTTVKLEAF